MPLGRTGWTAGHCATRWRAATQKESMVSMTVQRRAARSTRNPTRKPRRRSKERRRDNSRRPSAPRAAPARGPERYPLHLGPHFRRCLPRTRGDRRTDHAVEISRTVRGRAAILALDGAGWHGSKALELPDNITLLTLPPYAPELNPIQTAWADLRANRLPSPSSRPTTRSSPDAAMPGPSSPTIPPPSAPSRAALTSKRPKADAVGISLLVQTRVSGRKRGQLTHRVSHRP